MKQLYVILPLVLCFTVSCQNKQSMAELEEYQARSENEKKNMEVVRRWIEEVNVENFEVLYEELFSKEFRHYVPSNAEPKSFEDYKEIGKHIYPAFHNLSHTIEDIVAKDNKVIARMTARATHGGDFYGIPPTGNKLEWSAIAIFELSEEKIIARWEEVNLFDLYQQIGMELQMKQKAK